MAHNGSAALASRNEAPALSGEVFGALINLSGRRRFTSQRLVPNLFPDSAPAERIKQVIERQV
eukprot:gene43442-53952_t